MKEYPEVDRLGRRYRKIGSIIEYEPTIYIEGIEVAVSEADKVRATLREQKERLKREAEMMDRKKPIGFCPFGRFRNACVMDCAWFDNGCLQNQGDTIGKKCPLTFGKCNGECMLYDNGCKLMRGSMSK